jgi:hypothetical protein
MTHAVFSEKWRSPRMSFAPVHTKETTIQEIAENNLLIYKNISCDKVAGDVFIFTIINFVS